ncbi:hypothetical protein [Cohnella herbarum]|uniref:Ig-like domain-containing protein n=1 Tax=Cohnella herbarum TaxID=2728023 RepID=A0A7Z2ZQJ9_9BACL|nr:hypothetical protein [Cohnella herbarum]QJD87112.1 hypothetical protein HH215_30680 [Cohnella herbarum]
MPEMYKLKATLSSNEGKRGEWAKLRVEYGNLGANVEIDKSIVRLSDYGIYDVMRQEEDGSFTWAYPIPYEAPIQTYEIEVYAIDKIGNKGPNRLISFAVTG